MVKYDVYKKEAVKAIINILKYIKTFVFFV
jgi:hypothetical protein